MTDANIINSVYPVSCLIIPPNRACAMIERRTMLESNPPIPTKKPITVLSKRSLHNLAYLVSSSPVKFSSFITLTYGKVFPHSGQESKAHLNVFLTWLRRKYKKPQYVWFLEFQKDRGAPHYHILLDIKCPGLTGRKKGATAWCRVAAMDKETEELNQPMFDKMMLVHNFEGAEKRRMWQPARSENGLRHYAVKYACKSGQKVVPENFQNVGRFWGSSRGVRVPEEQLTRIPLCEWMAREILISIGRADVAAWDVLPKHVYGEFADKALAAWRSD